MHKGQRPSKHLRVVNTRHGKRRVLVNSAIFRTAKTPIVKKYMLTATKERYPNEKHLAIKNIEVDKEGLFITANTKKNAAGVILSHNLPRKKVIDDEGKFLYAKKI